MERSRYAARLQWPPAHQRGRAKATDHRPAQHPHLITEELPFGFYVSLLGRGNGYDQRLWRPALFRAFPGYRGPRQNLHRKVDYLRIFRNKIAHHGPIHHRHLTADHDAILECLRFIDPELAAMVERHSRVSEVLTRRP